MKAFVIDGGYGDGIDAIRVSIEIALVSMGSAIAAGKDEHGSFARPALVDTVEHSARDEDIWALHSTAIIRGSPTAAVN